jgi:hypothetical protein
MLVPFFQIIYSTNALLLCHLLYYEKFEDTKGVIGNVYRRRTDNTMAKGKSTKGYCLWYILLFYQLFWSFFRKRQEQKTINKLDVPLL